MCWNESVSMNTFIFGSFAVLFSYFNNILDIYQSLLLISIFAIQLVEFFIWRNINNKEKNKLYSDVAEKLLVIQPLLSILTITNNNFKIIGFIIYLIYIGILEIKRFSNKLSIPNFSSIGKNKHLRWDWLTKNPYYIMIYLILLIGPILLWKDKFIAIISIITLIISLIFFAKDGTWGSIWCWSSNIIALYLVYKVFAKELCI
jgi:hypothetical protein